MKRTTIGFFVIVLAVLVAGCSEADADSVPGTTTAATTSTAATSKPSTSVPTTTSHRTLSEELASTPILSCGEGVRLRFADRELRRAAARQRVTVCLLAAQFVSGLRYAARRASWRWLGRSGQGHLETQDGHLTVVVWWHIPPDLGPAEMPMIVVIGGPSSSPDARRQARATIRAHPALAPRKR
jgi:hypothetical protein